MKSKLLLWLSIIQLNSLFRNIDMLDRIGKALLEYETIDGRELEIIMRGEQLSRSKPLQKVKFARRAFG